MNTLRFLGTGTSCGVPQIGCASPVCSSSDPQDIRLRAAALLEGKGAWRIHGGGFAGCIQCLVPIPDYESFRAAMDGYYGIGACFELRTRSCGAYALRKEV